MTEHPLEARAEIKMGVTANPTVIRGRDSWTFFYVLLGFAVAIEGTMVAMIEPLHWWVRELLFMAVAAFTFWAILFNGKVQDRLIGWKIRYEDQAR